MMRTFHFSGPDIINMIIGFCVCIIFIAVTVNFLNSQDKKQVKKEKKSIVETGTMTAFFVVIYFVLISRIGRVELGDTALHTLLVVFGLLLIISGTLFNIYGRWYLGSNWANQIRIYSNHSMVTGGPFGLVRHPLYASIIGMFYGASLVYSNWVVFIMTTIIFLPFMYYRARQEEILLSSKFAEYPTYKKRVGMFFPRLLEPGNPTATISNYEFLFCRISLTLSIWISFLYQIPLLAIIAFLFLIGSVIFKVQKSPTILLYRYTLGRFFPGKNISLSSNGIRLAHLFGTVLLGLSLAILYFVNEPIGWRCILLFAIIKTISALGFCPVSKIYTCAGSGCCPFMKKFHLGIKK